MSTVPAQLQIGLPKTLWRALRPCLLGLLYRYRVDWADLPRHLRWPKQQPNHALDVDHQPGQQILDAVSGPPTIARPTAIVLADHLGQFALDGRMLAADLLIHRGGGFRA